MGSLNDWQSRLADALGPPSLVETISGNAWRVVIGGRPLLAKIGEGVSDEAHGLRQLALVTGAAPVPEVVFADAGLLATTWVHQGPRSPALEEALGRGLAALHRAPHEQWGGGSSWIGRCHVDATEAPTAAAFYGTRLTDLAARCNLAAPIERVVERLGELLPSGPPALVHGDLWWGNVLWGADGRPWLIDPSVHGGHPEEDLAMLALFGDVPSRILDAYSEVMVLDDGRRQRIELFQLYPLLVHAVLFGGRYRSQAAAIADRLGG